MYDLDKAEKSHYITMEKKPVLLFFKIEK